MSAKKNPKDIDEAVKEGRAHAIVSAGNTGAFMAISMFFVWRSFYGMQISGKNEMGKHH